MNGERRSKLWPLSGVLVLALVAVAPQANAAFAMPDTVAIARLLVDDNGDRIPDAVGTRFTVEGITLSATFSVTVDARRLSRTYLYDGSAAIMLQVEDSEVLSGLRPGHEIRVSGLLGFYNGSPTLAPESREDLGTQSVPEPRAVSIADLNSDRYEGQLIVATGRLTNAQNTELVDRTGAIRIRTRIALRDPQLVARLESGQRARVTGIASQYDPSFPHDGGYRIELLGGDSSVVLMPDYRWLYVSLALSAVFAILIWLAFAARRQAERDRRLLREVEASQDALALSEQKLQLVARATSDVIWELFVDEDRLIRESGSDVLFRDQVENRKQSRRDLFRSVHPEDRERVETSFDDALVDGDDQWKSEYRVVRNDGSRLFLRDQALIERNADGSARYVVGAAQDITETAEERRRKAILDARLQHAQRTESLGVLAGGIAHDFNNILAVITGQSEMLRQQNVSDEKRRERAQEILKATQRGSNLAHRMLAYAGKAAVTKAQISLNGIVRDTQSMLAEVLSKKVVLIDELQADLPAVLCDEGQLQQVVMNLVMNAAESYGDDNGEVWIETSCRGLRPDEYLQSVSGKFPTEKDYVILTVRDSGNGMDRETVARIFEPFFSSKGASRGMGLSAVIGIVNTHDGHLLVKSIPGKGSEFKVLLEPYRASATAAPDKVPEVLNSTEATLSGTVLIADDEDGIRDFELAVLQQLGATVLEARDGDEALALFESNRETLALAVLDVSMPKMSGVEVFERIRAMTPLLPVVLISGLGAHEIASQIGEAENVVVLSKPVGLDEFRSTVLSLASSEST